MKYYSILILLFIAACTSGKKMTEEKNSGAEKELITKNLKKGEKLYIMDCSGCHAMHKPAEFTAAQWQPILSRMFVKSKISDTETQALITNYILSKSK